MDKKRLSVAILLMGIFSVSTNAAGAQTLSHRKADKPEDFIWERYGGWFENYAYVGMNALSTDPSHMLRCNGEETQYFSRSQFKHILDRMMTYWRTHIEYGQQTDYISMTDAHGMVFKGHVGGIGLVGVKWAEFNLRSNDDNRVWCYLTMFPKYETDLQALLDDANYEEALKSVREKINARKKFMEDDPFNKI